MATERKMSPKGFLHKANGKISAIAFLSQHRAWLTTGELADKTSPILAKLDSGELMATPALEAVKEAVFQHHIASEIRKGEEAIAKAEAEEASGGTSKSYIATVYDASGEIPQVWVEKKDPETGAVTGKWKDLQESFDLPQRAEGWLDRKLAAGAPDWRGEVASTKMTGKDGLPITTHVTRGDAIARELRRPKGPVMNAKPKSTGRLGFGVKSNPDRNVRANMG
jgi:hypothetical protein